MYFKQIETPGIGCLSYVIGCPAAKVAAVIDPKREIQEYLDITRNQGMKITHVIETHIHADHISGNLEITARTGADIYFYEKAPVAFKHKTLKEGDTIELGTAILEVLHTPGHTPHSISLLVKDTSRSEEEPWFMLTGDLLFVGDVGRPDLAGKELLEKQVKNLYESIYKKLGKLPDRLGVYPAHGQGSLCGKGISSKTSTTLGYERHANPLLRLDSLDEFKKSLMREYPDRPKSFSHIISMNMKGAPWLDKFNDDRPLTPLQFREALKRGAKIIDTRDASAYGGVHIPGSINIGFGSQMANWIGMAVEPESNILLVFTEDTKYRDMRSILYRIGYDNIIGYLQSGISAWQEQGFPIQRLPQISAQELRDEIKSSTYQYIIVIRSESAWNKGHIEEAELLPLSDMLLKEVDLPKEEKIIVTCRVGYRGSIGASYLQLHGYTNVHNLAGGMQAWSNAGLPLKV